MSWTAEMMGIDIDSLRRESFTDLGQIIAHREHEAKAQAYWGGVEAPKYETTLTLNKAAALAGYNQNYFWLLVKHGQIPGKKVAGRWVIERADVVAWLATRRKLQGCN